MTKKLSKPVDNKIWVAYGKPEQQFSAPTDGNALQAFTTGKQYFAALIVAIRDATQSIYIAGWQVNWDAQLDEAGTRLFDILLEAARRKVRICVMPWNDPLAGVQTYDSQTKAVLEYINVLLGGDSVEVLLASTQSDEAESFFSHHQKQVVIDEKIAFVGGLDIAYGRFDDEHYTLQADAEGRQAMNRYNGCVTAIGKQDAKLVIDGSALGNATIPSDDTLHVITQMQQGARWQRSDDGLITLDATKQPRMPWQDVHCQIHGPAVSALAQNFVMRWNSADPQKSLPWPVPGAAIVGAQCSVQVLRSASLKMRETEYVELPPAVKTRSGELLQKQDDILQAMLHLIDQAQQFIYLENQFFVSNFGQVALNLNSKSDRPAQQVMDAGGGFGRTLTRLVAGDADTLPSNPLLARLGKKIRDHILASTAAPFHVYLTLPVHPEGKLNDGAVMGQIHFTMQSLVFGSQSLLNQVRRALCAKQLRQQNPATDWQRVFQDDNREFEQIPLEACNDYVSLLNLRNWAQLKNGRYVTEQIYIHSKLMIVDDRYALFGSANINDRSLLGSRDSELAVLVADQQGKPCDLANNGVLQPTADFARQLRQSVWRKIFGITAGGEKAANELELAVKFPAAPASWRAIRARAQQNTQLYEAAFDWIPRNYSQFGTPDKPQPASIWPRWNAQKNLLNGPMPFDAGFWAKSQHGSTAINLNQVKGFITLLPLHWTEGEDNHVPYHNMLLEVAPK